MTYFSARTSAVLLAIVVGTPRGLAEGLDVQLHVQAIVWTTPRHSTPRYYLWPHLTVSGLTYGLHPANKATVVSGDGAFSDDIAWPAISPEFESFAALHAAIENSGTWRIEITDGATGASFVYTFTLSAGMLSQNHLRPVYITGISSGEPISRTPSFPWVIAADEPTGPLLRPNSLEALLIGPSEVRRYLSVDSREWTSPRALIPGSYRFYITMDRSRTDGVEFLVPSAPLQQSGPQTNFHFSGYSYAYSGAVLVDLSAGSSLNCTGDFDRDGRIGAADLVHLLQFFGAPVPYAFAADLNLDGVVNTPDLIVFLRTYGQTCH